MCLSQCIQSKKMSFFSSMSILCYLMGLVRYFLGFKLIVFNSGIEVEELDRNFNKSLLESDEECEGDATTEVRESAGVECWHQ